MHSEESWGSCRILTEQVLLTRHPPPKASEKRSGQGGAGESTGTSHDLGKAQGSWPSWVRVNKPLNESQKAGIHGTGGPGGGLVGALPAKGTVGGEPPPPGQLSQDCGEARWSSFLSLYSGACSFPTINHSQKHRGKGWRSSDWMPCLLHL